MKASKLIYRALLEIGVVAPSETPTADQSADALTELQMLADTERERIKTSIPNWPTEPVELFDELGSVPAIWLHFLQLGLSVALCPSYGLPVSAELLAKYNRALRIIERDSAQKYPRAPDQTLASMTYNDTFNILSGE